MCEFTYHDIYMCTSTTNAEITSTISIQSRIGRNSENGCSAKSPLLVLSSQTMGILMQAKSSGGAPCTPSHVQIRGFSDDGGMTENGIGPSSTAAAGEATGPVAMCSGPAGPVRPILSPLHSRRLSESLWAADPASEISCQPETLHDRRLSESLWAADAPTAESHQPTPPASSPIGLPEPAVGDSQSANVASHGAEGISKSTGGTHRASDGLEAHDSTACAVAASSIQHPNQATHSSSEQQGSSAGADATSIGNRSGNDLHNVRFSQGQAGESRPSSGATSRGSLVSRHEALSSGIADCGSDEHNSPQRQLFISFDGADADPHVGFSEPV